MPDKEVKFRFLFILIAISMSFRGIAQDMEEQILPKMVVEGHYYSNMEMAELHNQKFTISLIKDKEGNRALLVLPADSFSLPKSLAQYEIPKNKVKNLEQFAEAADLIIGMAKATGSDSPEPLKEGMPLPGDFHLKDLDGKVWSKEDLKEKIVVVNVWYSGCGPCRKEMTILSGWKDENPDVLFLSVNFQAPEIVKDVTEKEGFNWTHLVKDDYFTKWVANKGYPLTIVIGPDGLVKKAIHGTNEAIREDVVTTFKGLNIAKRGE